MILIQCLTRDDDFYLLVDESNKGGSMILFFLSILLSFNKFYRASLGVDSRHTCDQ